MFSVGIIGCGIFGASIGVELAERGYKVTIYEKLSGPVQGASLNNQNRLHLGFHYPRDTYTASQCIEGFEIFKNKYRDAIVGDFKNAYFIAEEGSKISPEDYIKFLQGMQLEYQIIDYHDFDHKINKTCLGVMTKELVYDCRILGDLLNQRIKSLNIEVLYNAEVETIKNDKKLNICQKNGLIQEFDFVINASYANSSSLEKNLLKHFTKRQYEYTFVPIIDTGFKKIGITVLDGNFMTLLPFGDSNYHLLYHVDYSVIDRVISEHIPATWMNPMLSPISKIDIQEHFQKMVNEASKFMPDISKAKMIDNLKGPRMVFANVEETDARPTIINQPLSNYISIFSGKVDTSVLIAQKVVKRVESYSNLVIGD